MKMSQYSKLTLDMLPEKLRKKMLAECTRLNISEEELVMSTENNNALVEESLKKINEVSDYLLKSNSMSGEYVYHSLRSM